MANATKCGSQRYKNEKMYLNVDSNDVFEVLVQEEGAVCSLQYLNPLSHVAAIDTSNLSIHFSHLEFSSVIIRVAAWAMDSLFSDIDI